MGAIEQCWEECEAYGFIRKETPRGLRFDLPPHLGEGGFEIWGDTTTVMVYKIDCVLRKQWVVFEYVKEKYLDFGVLNTGDINFYQKRTELFPIEAGLNCFVNYPFLAGYKKAAPGVRLNGMGLMYRENFFDTLPFALPEDFWESAASVLNPVPIVFPPITLICEQINSTSLVGANLKMFIYGKGIEALSLLLSYIYEHKKSPSIRLASQDRGDLEQIKNMLRGQYCNPPSIQEMAVSVGMNQRKLMAGFKQLNGMTIYAFVKHIRMEKAVELLRENVWSIREVAQAVGYHGDGHFQKAFRDVYGVTPGKLSKDLLSNENLHDDCYTVE